MHFSPAAILFISVLGAQAVPLAFPRLGSNTLVRRQEEPYSVVNVGGANPNGVDTSSVIETQTQTVTAPSIPQAPVTVTVTNMPTSTSTPVITPSSWATPSSSSCTPSSKSLSAWPTPSPGDDHSIYPRSSNLTRKSSLPPKSFRRSLSSTNSTGLQVFNVRSDNATERVPISARTLLNGTVAARSGLLARALNQTGRVY
ncbi:uncharacterized protein P174DRAFT_444085 [Aspergillus novofumigatus IBT 16806]|uniref:Uncharacterized protein n=1 Tax=Aspergillus novofumigatus (strain IBT 16806) TaxID=1392255 RepID=A0A2I1C357_ASPN1|nr:uncharacterized protein P174DRAFT_444085 [Aspergillus novofumigatus IBT 16806]PKX92059.1 hypothetical protein P174DRAFT_444085 [Aspergillus novofumigatus IBT 16806]